MEKKLLTAVLEAGPQLHWRTWWRDKAKVIKQQGRARCYEASQD